MRPTEKIDVDGSDEEGGTCAKPFFTKKDGQLWEPCEQCGDEPCYTPLFLCDKCWPNGN